MPVRDDEIGSSMHVTFVGAGGVAAALARPVCLTLNYTRPSSVVRVWDGDFFELANRDRQQVEAGQEGKNKAISLTQRLQPEFGNISVEPVPRFVIDADVRAILEWSDVVFVVPDNDATRALLVHGFRKSPNGLLVVVGVDPVDHARGLTGESGTVHFHVRRDGQDMTNDFETFHTLAQDDHPAQAKAPGCLELLASRNQLVSTNLAVALGAYMGFCRFLAGELPAEDVYVNTRLGTVASIRRPLLEADESDEGRRSC